MEARMATPMGVNGNPRIIKMIENDENSARMHERSNVQMSAEESYRKRQMSSIGKR